MAINHKEHNQSKGMSKRLARAEKVLSNQPHPGRVSARARGAAAAVLQQVDTCTMCWYKRPLNADTHTLW